MIRFSYYLIKDIPNQPYAIKWFRYSAFIVLYLIGILHELYSLYQSKDAFFDYKPILEPPIGLIKVAYMIFITFMVPCIVLYD